jgi:short-subunit dehydrogenase
MSINNESIIVITGAASGIGQATARRLTDEKIGGLALSDVNETGLRETARMLENTGIEVSTHIVNIADKAAVEAFAAEVVAHHGRVTHLLNNAGVSLFGDFEEISAEDFEWLMNINFWGVVNSTRAFLPVLREQKSAQILNVSSVFGFVGIPGNAAYCASKFAVRGFTESLRHELAGTNVTVSTIHPGGIKTNIANSGRLGAKANQAEKSAMTAAFNNELTRSTPECAAETIVRGMKSRSLRILIGTDARLISLIYRIFPQNYLKVLDLLSGGKLLKGRADRKKLT